MLPAHQGVVGVIGSAHDGPDLGGGRVGQVQGEPPVQVYRGELARRAVLELQVEHLVGVVGVLAVGAGARRLVVLIPSPTMGIDPVRTQDGVTNTGGEAGHPLGVHPRGPEVLLSLVVGGGLLGEVVVVLLPLVGLPIHPALQFGILEVVLGGDLEGRIAPVEVTGLGQVLVSGPLGVVGQGLARRIVLQVPGALPDLLGGPVAIGGRGDDLGPYRGLQGPGIHTELGGGLAHRLAHPVIGARPRQGTLRGLGVGQVLPPAHQGPSHPGVDGDGVGVAHQVLVEVPDLRGVRAAAEGGVHLLGGGGPPDPLGPVQVGAETRPYLVHGVGVGGVVVEQEVSGLV